MKAKTVDETYLKLRESINIIEQKTLYKTILFTDVVKSAELWNTSENAMILGLEEQSRKMDKFSKKHKGFILKSIGDAYMILFESLVDAIEFSIDFQRDSIKNPIKVGKKDLTNRIGIGSGPVMKTIVFLQNKKLDDYMGNTVNTASRLESKVSDPNNFAFTYLNDKDVNIDEIDALLEDNNINVTQINFSNKGNEVKRSGRILTEVHRRMNKNIKELKGVENLTAYKCKMKLKNES